MSTEASSASSKGTNVNDVEPMDEKTVTLLRDCTTLTMMSPSGFAIRCTLRHNKQTRQAEAGTRPEERRSAAANAELLGPLGLSSSGSSSETNRKRVPRWNFRTWGHTPADPRTFPKCPALVAMADVSRLLRLCSGTKTTLEKILSGAGLKGHPHDNYTQWVNDDEYCKSLLQFLHEAELHYLL
ncbi:hypothetical protein HPB47_013058 [Ixodes persulcatus]|uniref:Uncharacterized protein n=1 Tax=Ixodes persulcatus TaxID=34615 RepID=A0AC60NRU1_IXOPE|nr:hypothetical protein HPB47_013058 [Ixodes persulcatus]